MTYEVRETPEAKRVHEKVLKGVARKRYEVFLTDLTTQGCKAGGKRLRVQGDEVSRYCARDFYARWRAHLVFEDTETIVVFAMMEAGHRYAMIHRSARRTEEDGNRECARAY